MVYILDSIANKDGKVRLYIHTRNDEVITVNPKLRVPKSFPRFVGIMEKLLLEDVIKTDDGEVLLECERGVLLQELLSRLEGDKVISLSANAEKGDLSDHIKGEVTVVVGGFSKGDFISKFEPDVRVSVYSEELTSWAVVAEVLKYL
jgi:rRNA small subunit pseudouridine methyltransferase Nep1